MGKIWAGLIKIRVDGVHDPKIVSPQTVGRPRDLARTGVKSGAVITPSSPAVPRGDPLNLAADRWRMEISLLFAVSIWLPQSLKPRR